MTTKQTVLTTLRLTLRALTEADAEGIFLQRSNPQVSKYLDRPLAESIDDGRLFIQKVVESVAAGGSYYWAMLTSDSPRLIGTICLWNISDDRKSADIGYELLPDYHGQGFMQEAVEAVLQFGFEQAGFKKIYAETHEENEASIRLLLRNGFKKEGYLYEKEAPIRRSWSFLRLLKIIKS